MELLLIVVTDVLTSGNKVVVEKAGVTELLAKIELVGMELLLVVGLDVLAYAEVMAELLVIGANTVVIVEFKRGVAVITGVTVLFVIVEKMGIELLSDTTLVETLNADDEGVMTAFDVVSGAIVGAQAGSEAVKVIVLSYTEVTSTDEICVEYRVSVAVTVPTQGSVV
jgi:hypothetical protein